MSSILSNYKNIFWDFDGVILDSMNVRDFGFREIFKQYESKKIEELISFHRYNGGLSRYVKIRYFYEEILKQSIDENQVLNYASSFSEIMKQELINPKNLILDSVDYIKSNYKNFNFHIVSGSDQTELRFLCKELNLDHYFKSIHGSPTEKKILVKNILSYYNPKECCLIGDSVNDYEAAENNSIDFFGYNNQELLKLNKQMGYIYNFASNN